jgi:outer membrane immunogenic protein
MPDDRPRLAAHGAPTGRRMRPMRWVICALVVLVAPAGARAGDFDVLRGAQPVGYASYTRWSGFYAGGQIGEEFDGANFRNVAGASITTISGLDAGFSSIPLNNFPHLTSLNTEKQSWSVFAGYNYQFEAAVVGVELNFTKTNLNASISDSESHNYFQNANGALYSATYNVNTAASASLQNYGTIRGQLGWAYGSFLPYAFGGVSIAQINATRSVNINYFGVAVPSASSPPPPPIGGNWTLADQATGKWYFGYVFGLGLDYALTQNIFLRGELEYVQFGAPFNIRLNTTSARIGAGLKF